MEQKQRQFEMIEWSIAAIVVLLAVIVWAMTRIYPGENLTLFDIFPLFGLLAFSLMWTHFISGALRRGWKVTQSGKNDLYMTVSMGMVLVLIVLHPGLLWYELWREGFGLPPASYLRVYDSQVFAALLGSVSLLIFLAFELRRWFKKEHWWKYIECAQVAAMIAIFFHALSLGGELSVGWYRVVWCVYAIVLIGATGYNYWYDKRLGGEARDEVK